MITQALSIKNLKVSVDKKTILHEINLELTPGSTTALMGPNGSGKSSLAYTIMGHPNYLIENGAIICFEKEINTLLPDQRAKLGIFLAMQNPYEIEGITIKELLRQAHNAIYRNTEKQLTVQQFNTFFQEQLELLAFDQKLSDRSINVGFSGGEKKRAEILQLAVLRPKIVILDEIDSGLDVDALKAVCHAINTIKKHEPSMTILVITHYPRILKYLKPQTVHIMQAGKITQTGTAELAHLIEQEGYR